MKSAFSVKWTDKIRIHSQNNTVERASMIRQVFWRADE